MTESSHGINPVEPISPLLLDRARRGLEPDYEIGALLRNPDNEQLDDAALRRRTLRRIDQLSEFLGFDRQRLAGWCFAQAVLSAWWSVEDGESEWGDALRLAEAVRDKV